jgi:hypothetical protein
MVSCTYIYMHMYTFLHGHIYIFMSKYTYMNIFEHIHNFVSIGKKQLDFEQFYEIVSALETAAEEGNMYLEKKEDGDEDELSEEDLKEVAKELFNELKGMDIISPTNICVFVYR